MRNSFTRSLVFAALFAGISTAHAAATVLVNPGSRTVGLGDTFSVVVSGTGFTTALDAGGLDIGFDSSVLQLANLVDLPVGVSSNVAYDSVWNLTSGPSAGPGSLNDAFFFADSAPSGDFDIMTIWFTAIGAGSSAVDLTESALNPFAGGGGALNVAIGDGLVNVNAVPLPAAAWLLASGLPLFGVITRRRNAK